MNGYMMSYDFLTVLNGPRMSELQILSPDDRIIHERRAFHHLPFKERQMDKRPKFLLDISDILFEIS